MFYSSCLLPCTRTQLPPLVLLGELSLVAELGVLLLVDVVLGVVEGSLVADPLGGLALGQLLDLLKLGVGQVNGCASAVPSARGSSRLDVLLKLASIREGVTDLGSGTMPRLRSQLRRMLGPATLCASAIFLTIWFSRRSVPAVPPRGEYAHGRMSFFFSQATSSGCGHWIDSSTWSVA